MARIRRTTQMAKMLGTTDSTIRDWSRQYAAFLSDAGVGQRAGATRKYNTEDQFVLSSIAFLRNDGEPHAKVKAELELGFRVAELPFLADDDEAAFVRGEVGLIPIERLQRAMDEVERQKSDLEAMRAELKDERQKSDTFQSRINELEREAGVLEGQLKERRRKLFR